MCSPLCVCTIQTQSGGYGDGDRVYGQDDDDKVAGEDGVAGGEGADAVYGGEGEDRMIGGGGIPFSDDAADYMVGGPGPDVVFSDYGNDYVGVEDGVQANDMVTCGAGDDTVDADVNDYVDESTCESVTYH